jgi:hypothetical protein
MEFGKSFISGLGSAGASSLTGLITGGISQALGLSWSPGKAMKEQLKYNKDIMALQNQYQQAAAAKSQQYAKDYWDYTNAENQAAHLRNAGLNIGLMYGQSGAGGMGASGGARQESPEQPQGNPVAMALQTQQIEQQRRMTDAQITLTEAQAKKAEEEAKKIGGVDTDKVIQEIKTLIQQEGWYKADAELRTQLRTESTEKVKEIQQNVELIKKQQFITTRNPLTQHPVSHSNPSHIRQYVPSLNDSNGILAFFTHSFLRNLPYFVEFFCFLFFCELLFF